MPAANIDQAIAFSGDYIAAVSYGGIKSLATQFNLWIAGMFSESTGIYKPSANPPVQAAPGPRTVTDWFAEHLMAAAAIEGPGIGQSGVVGTSAVIDAVSRVLSAVKFAVINGFISAGQQTATVTLFNTCWA